MFFASLSAKASVVANKDGTRVLRYRGLNSKRVVRVFSIYETFELRSKVNRSLGEQAYEELSEIEISKAEIQIQNHVIERKESIWISIPIWVSRQ